MGKKDTTNVGKFYLEADDYAALRRWCAENHRVIAEVTRTALEEYTGLRFQQPQWGGKREKPPKD